MSALDEIRGRLNAATPGPWAVEEDDDGFDGHSVYEDDGITWGRAYVCREMHQGEDEGKSDAEFIAHAPTDVARLLADVQNVLNLHAPRTERSDEPYCRHCYSPPYGHAPYPCPTVQLITTALEAKP